MSDKCLCLPPCAYLLPQITFAKQPFNNLRKRFPYLTSNGFDLLNRFLTYDPNKRITGEGGLEHAYFKVIVGMCNMGRRGEGAHGIVFRVCLLHCGEGETHGIYFIL